MAKRRGNGEGSITRRKDGTYMARYTGPLHSPDGHGAEAKTIYAKMRPPAVRRRG